MYPALDDAQLADHRQDCDRLKVGSTLWVNRPDGGAESLDDDDILVLRTTGSQLCSIDTLELHDRTSRMYSGFVSLGEFVPYRRAKAE